MLDLLIKQSQRDSNRLDSRFYLGGEMYIECQNCIHRQGNKCDIDGKYAEPNHVYASDSHCKKDK